MAKNSVCFKCANCGEEYTWEHAHKQKSASRGNIRYICTDCAEIKRYSTKNNTKRRTEKKHGITIGYELECIPYGEVEYNSMISSQYQLLPTSDCSLDDGGVEFKTPIYYSTNGQKQMLRTLVKYADFKNPSCGQHINIGHVDYINEETIQDIIFEQSSIFDPLGEYLCQNSEACIKVFGRWFNDYAEYYLGMNYESHYAFISLGKKNCIEFRLSKLMEVNQYFWLTCMCKEMVECIIKNFILKSTSHEDAEKTGRKLVKIFQKYEQGKATCQRPERNSK